MRLTYNYNNGDYSVHREEATEIIKKEMNGLPEFVLTFDISHWTSEDFVHFTELGEGDQAGLLEGLACIGNSDPRFG